MKETEKKVIGGNIRREWCYGSQQKRDLKKETDEMNNAKML